MHNLLVHFYLHVGVLFTITYLLCNKRTTMIVYESLKREYGINDPSVRNWINILSGKY